MVDRRYPVSTQTFSNVRERFDVYVDKTAHIYEIITKNSVVFLARPRRFGKSLLCSTIASVFQNKRELFKGLAIDKSDWVWQEHPVVHLDLISGEQTDIIGLKNSINDQFDEICLDYDISVEQNNDISSRFRRIITTLSRKMNTVVVIIDEYDNPLLKTVDNPILHEEIRKTLQEFYGILKKVDEHLRFVFITGITKFAQVSMFSDMNQPDDISTLSEYSDICGISQAELEENFKQELDEYSVEYGGRDKYIQKLKNTYDGYCFSQKKLSVYNPFGLIRHFNNKGDFSSFWTGSGTPTFMVKYIDKNYVDFVNIENVTMKKEDFANYRFDKIKLIPLLYQSGYLTITDYDKESGLYTLNYPNTEVREYFANFLAESYSNSQKILDRSLLFEFMKTIVNGDVKEFMELLKIYLHRIDYSLSSKITEYYFEFAVSNIINMLGLVCEHEVHTATGRIDSVILTPKRIYVFEFKVDKPIENAIKQIKRKDYALFYANDGREIIKIGVVFSREEKNIVNWKVKV